MRLSRAPRGSAAPIPVATSSRWRLFLGNAFLAVVFGTGIWWLGGRFVGQIGETLVRLVHHT